MTAKPCRRCGAAIPARYMTGLCLDCRRLDLVESPQSDWVLAAAEADRGRAEAEHAGNRPEEDDREPKREIVLAPSPKGGGFWRVTVDGTPELEMTSRARLLRECKRRGWFPVKERWQ